ncbi:TPA: hypothetical protein HA351_02560 [Methanosarcinaceae archaeon]|nr:hypothetical protein [Methanosarcinaceae archaeon]
MALEIEKPEKQIEGKLKTRKSNRWKLKIQKKEGEGFNHPHLSIQSLYFPAFSNEPAGKKSSLTPFP